ncbi:hypothetical protein DFS34DRAFT_689215 [Phlyctochytrium arcticum]|nr:hypothetical protein DFS34DRAFT_598513 [Phlyctochytrium arcticum]KAI9089878.1 hypothetical protein DFS34DRAFT_689215 [Phlyctochytrium arcticum]
MDPNQQAQQAIIDIAKVYENLERIDVNMWHSGERMYHFLEIKEAWHPIFLSERYIFEHFGKIREIEEKYDKLLRIPAYFDEEEEDQAKALFNEIQLLINNIVATIDNSPPEMFQRSNHSSEMLPAPITFRQRQCFIDGRLRNENGISKHEKRKQEPFQREREQLVIFMGGEGGFLNRFRKSGFYETQHHFKRLFFANLSESMKNRGTNKKITCESVWRLYEEEMGREGFQQVHQYFCGECGKFWKKGCCEKYSPKSRGKRLWIVKNALFPDEIHEKYGADEQKWGAC